MNIVVYTQKVCYLYYLYSLNSLIPAEIPARCQSAHEGEDVVQQDQC